MIREKGETTSEFEVELRVSPKSVVAVLLVLGAVLVFVRNPQAEYPFFKLNALLLGILLLAGSAIALLLENWKSWASPWFIVVLSVGVIALVDGWLDAPGSLVLMVIPTSLAAALIGLWAAAATALGATVLIFLLPGPGTTAADWATMSVAIVAVWGILGVMCAIYHRLYQLSRWSWTYYRDAQELLDEARDQKAQLAQALDNLAHANRQLALTNERITMLRLIAEDAQRVKSRFAAHVSHEFRTPLNVVTGLVGLMVEAPDTYNGEIPPDLSHDLEMVHRNCQHLLSMVNDVLDLTKMDANPDLLHRERVGLAEIVDSAMAMIRPLVERKRLSLQVSLPDDLPNIYCDRMRIRQVILNLLSNAARLTDRGRITIHASRDDQSIIVAVADTGPGIPPEDTERIFEPFFLGSSQLPRRKGGGGLGLSISKRFVELHGGRIWCESKVGEGSTFYFRLPLSLPVEPVARPGHQIRESWIWRESAFRTERAVPPDHFGKPRVIMCDETGGLRPNFMRYSDKVDLVDAEDATQVTRDLQQCPAHVVVLNTAGPDGLLSRIKAISQNAPGTPIIGCCVPRVTMHELELGATGYLMKPVTLASLDEAMRAAGKAVRQILVVDDDADFLSFITRMLHTYDSTLEVTGVTSCEQAMEELCSRSPDLVLLDLVMPGMNGWQLLEFLHQDGKTQDIPVFIMSAQDPEHQPLMSQFLLATIDDGLSVRQLLRCSLGFSRILSKLDREPGQVLV